MFLAKISDKINHKGDVMKKYRKYFRPGLLGALLISMTSSAFAQSDPWTASAQAMRDAFTGPIATALVLVGIVITGLTFAFSEGQGKKAIAGLAFGGSMCVGAVRFAAWLFP
jgi:type IV secretory pathway VirB2 component (pilin)